ncbi:MAG: hypothetical protein M9904_11275 [Chitinophagaceae bacterium]|nr:hypothetical protein [Chitinophagaceae bacterium]
MKKLLVLKRMSEEVREVFVETLSPYFEIEFAISFDPEYLREKVEVTDVCFGSSLPDSVVETARNLKVFQLAGTGVDRLNLTLFEKKGIRIYKAQAHSRYVAEFAIAMLHALVKKIAYFDCLLRKNDIPSLKNIPGIDFNSYTLFEKCIGIIGYGHIGRSIHQLLQPYTDRFLINAAASRPKDELMGAIQVELEKLIKTSDVIFIACPLTVKTKGMIGKEAFQSASDKSIWVNISRGEIIDFNALLYALNHKQIGGVAIDNWYPDIPDAQKRLSLFSSVVLSPYRATHLTDKEPNMTDALGNLLRIGKGETPAYQVDYGKGY